MICCIIHWQSHLMILDATTGKGQIIPTFPGYSSYGDKNISLHLLPSITQILLPFFSQFLLIRPIWTKRGGSRLRPPLTAGVRVNIHFQLSLKWHQISEREPAAAERSCRIRARDAGAEDECSRPASKHSLNDCNSIRLNFMERLLRSRLSLGGLEEPRVRGLPFNRQKPRAGPGCW